MAFQISPITDPDLINSTGAWSVDHYASSEIYINPVTKTFYFLNGGNLANEGTGVTGQALYSFFKDRWKDTVQLTQFDFPMLSITNEQFEFSDGWKPAGNHITASDLTFAAIDDSVTTAGAVDFTKYFAVGDPIIISGTTSNNFSLTVLSVTTTKITFNENVIVDEGTANATANLLSFYISQVGGLVTTTRKLIRSAGWAEIASDGTSVGRKYAGIVSLGSFVSDQDAPYFAQDPSFTATTATTEYTGPVNEAVQIFGNNAIDASSPINTDLSGYFKIYLRERGKIYADANLTAIGVSAMTTIVYRFPLSNSNDLKLETTLDTEIDIDNTMPASVAPYDKIDITYLPNTIKGAYTNATVYAAGDVVQDVGDSSGLGAARWFYTVLGGTSSGVNLAADVGVTWAQWDLAAGGGEREVEAGIFSAYNRIIDGYNLAATTTSPYTHAGGGDRFKMYDWAQWALRLPGIIDTDLTRNGNVADLLVEFVGDQLHTKPGVFIDDFLPADTNSVTFHDYLDVLHLYPLVVTVTINFNSNLSADSNAVFYAYYKDPDGIVNGNEFGTVGALQVQSVSAGGNVGLDVTNNVPDGVNGSQYQFTYAYDGDTTGGRTVSSPTPIVVVAIGLTTGQYIQAEGTITSAGSTVTLTSATERNYNNPI